MKSKIYRLTCLIVSLLVAVFTVGYAFSWILDRKDADEYLNGASAGAYFAGGDGSYANPFIIKQPVHMYNLAWLQNTGRFVDENNKQKKYFFEVENDITMPAGYKLPPIGNDENPFISSFNGKGHTITNLHITTDKTQLYASPLESNPNYAFSNAVGMFGMTQNPPAIANTTDPDNGKVVIKNFILEDPQVEVASQNTLYSATGNKSAGIAVGFVAGKCSSVGVKANAGQKTTLDIKLADYHTFNSILGELDSGVTSSVTGGGVVTGGDIGYGAPTDLQELYQSLGGSDGNAVEAGMAFPFKVADTAFVPPTSSTVKVTLDGGEKDVLAATTQVATSSNIGYYVGSDLKGYYKPRKVDYSKFFYPGTNSQSYELPYENGSVSYPAPEQDVIDYLKDTGAYLLRMTGKTQVNVINEGDLVVVPNGQVGSYKGNILVPRRCIWVAPVMAGKLRFVFMNIEGNSMGARLLKLTRLTPGDYSTKFTKKEELFDFNNLMLSGKAYYIEMEVTQKDIAAGYEYAVTAGDGYNPYMAFIDIGANGGNVHLGQVDKEKDVSAVDFVYDGVTIKQESETDTLKIGDFIVGASGAEALYEATKTSIYFEDYENALQIVYVRLHGRDDGKTINLANYTSETIKNSGVKATLKQFVLPEGITGGSSSGGGGGGGEVVDVPTTAIEVTAGKTAIAIGETVQLSVKFTPSNATNRVIDWSIVSGKDYASLNEVTGEITGTSAGEVIVQATSGAFTDTITINVGSGSVATESIKITADKTTIATGETAQLSVEFTPSDATNRTVSWTIVSGSEYASLNIITGEITGVDAGEVTVRATSGENNNIYDEIKITVAKSSSETAFDLSKEFNDTSGRNLSIKNGPVTIASDEKYKGVSGHKIDEVSTSVLIANGDNIKSFKVVNSSKTNKVKVTVKVAVSAGNNNTTIAAKLTASNGVTLNFTAGASLSSQNLVLEIDADTTVTITTDAGRINILAVSYIIV